MLRQCTPRIVAHYCRPHSYRISKISFCSIMVGPLIALEEHFDSGVFQAKDELHENLPPHLHERLEDIGDLRLKDIDAGGISLQVISHVGPLETSVEGCRQANDKLATACQKYPKRYAGFALLPMQDPPSAADELERTVKQHGFVGALINNHLDDGTMYDDERFWPVFERAVILDRPVYIHPNYPGSNLSSHYDGNFSKISAIMMSTASWGWHAECGLHIIRLFASGLFDRFPTLKIVIGHMGEMLPYMLDRTIHATRHWGEYKRDLRTVWNENIWVTTSGLFTLPPFECLLKMSPMDKIMYSVDYPFSTTETGLKFVKEIEKSGLLSKHQFDAFCYGNAEKLLRVKASA